MNCLPSYTWPYLRTDSSTTPLWYLNTLLFVSRVPICQKFKNVIKDTFRKEEEKYQALKHTQKICVSNRKFKLWPWYLYRIHALQICLTVTGTLTSNLNLHSVNDIHNSALKSRWQRKKHCIEDGFPCTEMNRNQATVFWNIWRCLTWSYPLFK